MAITLPSHAVVRVSRGDFDPARFAEVERMAKDSGAYLIPKIKALSGLAGYFVACSPSGTMTHVSLWNSDAEASQMGKLKEMTVDARQAAEAVGVRFVPIVNYPIVWTI